MTVYCQYMPCAFHNIYILYFTVMLNVQRLPFSKQYDAQGTKAQNKMSLWQNGEDGLYAQKL